MSEDHKLVPVEQEEDEDNKKVNLLTFLTQNTRSEFNLTQDDEGVNAEFKSIFKISKAISEYLEK